MSFRDSVEILQHKNYKVIVQYKIEPMKYDRFKHKFTTDKYINLCEWEIITSKIAKAIDAIARNKKDWHTLNETFEVSDMTVSYSTLSKYDSYINYKKINYELDWIIEVQIEKTSRRSRIEEMTSSSSKTLSSVQEDALNDENAVIVDDDDNVEHEQKKKRTEEPAKKTSPLLPKNRFNFKPQTREDTKQQSTLNNYVVRTEKKRKLEPSSSKQGASKQLKPSGSKDSKSSDFSDAVERMSEEQKKSISDVLAKLTKESDRIEQRKEELKNVEIYNCCDMNEDEISNAIKYLKPDIKNIFATGKSSLMNEAERLEPYEITSANIFSRDQTLFALSEIENIRPPAERGTNESILHDHVLPFVIIDVFKSKYNLTTANAIQRIKLQDEKKRLLNLEEYGNDSF